MESSAIRVEKLLETLPSCTITVVPTGHQAMIDLQQPLLVVLV
jgi:hypothetical protein